MCYFAAIFFHNDKLKYMLNEKCPLRASPIFIDIPSDIMMLLQIDHRWNSTEDTPQFTGIPPHIILMSEIEGLRRKIKSLKREIINQLHNEMDKRRFYSMDHNTNTIIDAMASQTKHIMEEIVRKTEVLTIKVTEVSGTKVSNLMDIAIDEEEEK